MAKKLLLVVAVTLTILGLGILVLVFSFGHWPVAKVVGVDSYVYHAPIFGDRSISQEFIAESDTLSRIEVLIVDYKKASPTASLILTLYDVDQDVVIRTAEVSGEQVRDDFYLPFAFSPIEAAHGRTYRFTIAAPAATKEAAYAVRYTDDKKSIAFSYSWPVSQLFIFRQWLSVHAKPLITLVVLATITALLALVLPWAASKKGRWWVALSGVLVAGTSLQLFVLRQLRGAIGGDGYYYLVAAKQITQGINPLADWSYRLPFYPLLLTPAVSTYVPDLLWGRILGVLTTIGIGFGLVWLAKALRMRPIVAVVTSALLYINTDFLITAVRVRPYTLFALLLLIATAAMFSIKKIKHAVWWGVLLGVMGMTRQEAYLPTALLGVAFVIYLVAQKMSWKMVLLYLLAASGPLLLIISPYFYANYRDTGNPFSTAAYTARDDLYFPDSLGAFWSGNLTRAGDAVGSVWLPSSQHGLRVDAGKKLSLILGVGIVVYSIAHWPGTKKWLRSFARHTSVVYVAVSLGIAALTVLIYRWQFLNSSGYSQDINLLLLAALVFGGFELIRIGRWRGVLVLTVLASQLLIATLFHPEAKHYQQSYPYLAFAAALILLPLAGISTTQNQATKQLAPWHVIRAVPLFLLIGWLGAASMLHLENAIDAHNYPAAAYFVTTAAAEELEQYPPGRAAAEVDYSKGDGIYRLHSYQQRDLVRFEEIIAIDQQLRWLCDNSIHYILDHGDLETLTLQTNKLYADDFTYLFEKTAAGLNNRKFRVAVYSFSDNACTTQ